MKNEKLRNKKKIIKDDDMLGREESSVPLRQSYMGQNQKNTG